MSQSDQMHEFKRELGLLDSTMIVIGSMIGSGIFIVSADISRTVGSPGYLLAVWLITGVITVIAAFTIRFFLKVLKTLQEKDGANEKTS